jgi:hypothetical protein
MDGWMDGWMSLVLGVFRCLRAVKYLSIFLFLNSYCIYRYFTIHAHRTPYTTKTTSVPPPAPDLYCDVMQRRTSVTLVRTSDRSSSTYDVRTSAYMMVRYVVRERRLFYMLLLCVVGWLGVW